MNKYYVYMYLRAADLTPYYIGKGCGRRAYVKQKNIKPPADRSLICIVKDKLTETDALAFETTLVAHYGRKDLGTGILRNMTDGGDGISGCKRVFTEEHKAKLRKPKKWSKEGLQRISDAQKGRTASNKGVPMSQEQKEKIRLANTGKTHSEVVRAKMSRDRKGRPGTPHSAETKKKLSDLNKGKTLSEETKKKIGDAFRGKKRPKKLCSHCGNMIAVNSYGRWHGDKCKLANLPCGGPG